MVSMTLALEFKNFSGNPEYFDFIITYGDHWRINSGVSAAQVRSFFFEVEAPNMQHTAGAFTSKNSPTIEKDWAGGVQFYGSQRRCPQPFLLSVEGGKGIYHGPVIHFLQAVLWL